MLPLDGGGLLKSIAWGGLLFRDTVVWVRIVLFATICRGLGEGEPRTFPGAALLRHLAQRASKRMAECVDGGRPSPLRDGLALREVMG